MSASLSARERKYYSLSRAILASDCMGNGAACLERDLSDQFVRDTRHNPTRGAIVIHPEVLLGANGASRALNASTLTAGGALVGEDPTPLFSYLFPQSVVGRLGARVVGGLVTDSPAGARGSIRLPVGTASDEAEWLPEANGPSANHTSTFGAAFASAKRVFTQRRISKQLLIQNGQGSSLVEILVMGAFAAALDRAALIGTGGAQPLGLMTSPGVNSVALGADGATPTLAALNSAEGKVITNRIPLTTPGWVLSPKTREKLKNTQKATGTSTFLLETCDNEDRCNGFSSYATAFLPDTGNKGAGTNLGSAIFGVWEWLFFLQWGGLEIVSDPYTYASAGDVLVSINGYADVVTPREPAFTVINDIVTA